MQKIALLNDIRGRRDCFALALAGKCALFVPYFWQGADTLSAAQVFSVKARPVVRPVEELYHA